MDAGFFLIILVGVLIVNIIVVFKKKYLLAAITSAVIFFPLLTLLISSSDELHYAKGGADYFVLLIIFLAVAWSVVGIVLYIIDLVKKNVGKKINKVYLLGPDEKKYVLVLAKDGNRLYEIQEDGDISLIGEKDKKQKILNGVRLQPDLL